MNDKIYKVGVAMSLCIATFATSCSDRITVDYTASNEQVPLEISVAGISKSRAIIPGSLLPDTCNFSVFYSSEFPISVSYEKGNCKLNESVFIEESAEPMPVYAFYPGEAYLTEIAIDTKVQTDYLRGVSVDGNGSQTNISASNPKASILFDHILARVTINIHKDAEVTDSYKFSDIYLGGDNENSYRSAVFDAKSNSFIYFFPNEYDDIKGELKDGKYWIETPEDVITVDFLVLPTKTTWWLNLKDKPNGWYALPETNYEAGKQYIFDCVIREDAKTFLTITQCDIKPWNNNTMPEVEGY